MKGTTALSFLSGSFFKQMIRLETANIMFEIWDTAGQEKYHSVCHLYYRGARAALLVYDISRKVRLKSCSSIISLQHSMVFCLIHNNATLLVCHSHYSKQ